MGGRDSQRFGRNAGPVAWQVARVLARTNAPNSAAWQHFIRQSYLRLMRIATRVSRPWQHSIRQISTRVSRPSRILKSSSKYRPFSLAIRTILKKSAADNAGPACRASHSREDGAQGIAVSPYQTKGCSVRELGLGHNGAAVPSSDAAKCHWFPFKRDAASQNAGHSSDQNGSRDAALHSSEKSNRPTSPVAAAGDRHGFEVEPALAKKLRNEIARLGQLKRRRHPRPEDQKTEQKLHQKIEAKIATLRCPCPSRYSVEDAARDEQTLARLWRRRRSRAKLTAREDTALAHINARYTACAWGPKAHGRSRLTALREKRRACRMAGGPRLSSYERAELRGGAILFDGGKWD
jgi:hypothetical protein